MSTTGRFRSPPAVLVVAGPTASGKTALAIELAQRLDTEIISADSMQVYKGMEIGTAAPSLEERARVTHHFVSCLDPKEQFSAGAFGRVARSIAARLNARGRIALLVGGSGLYIRAAIDGLFPGPGKDEAVRRRLHDEADRFGVAALYSRLETVDPGYAAVILPGDLRRIVRALEVYELTGEPMSRLHRRHRAGAPPLDALQIAVDLPRDVLYARIDARVDRMIEAGFLEEVRALMDRGCLDRFAQLRTLGYREFAEYLEGRKTYAEAVEEMKRNTRRYARRQLIWFRGDTRIHWLRASGDTPVGDLADRALALIEGWSTRAPGSL